MCVNENGFLNSKWKCRHVASAKFADGTIVTFFLRLCHPIWMGLGYKLLAPLTPEYKLLETYSTGLWALRVAAIKAIHMEVQIRAAICIDLSARLDSTANSISEPVQVEALCVCMCVCMYLCNVYLTHIHIFRVEKLQVNNYFKQSGENIWLKYFPSRKDCFMYYLMICKYEQYQKYFMLYIIICTYIRQH